MKNMKPWVYALLLLISAQTVKAIKGPNCDSAKVLSYPATNTVSGYTADAYWCKITLGVGNFSMKITNTAGVGKITKANLYTGTCAALTPVKIDSLSNPADASFNIVISNTVSTTYYIKLVNKGGSVSFNQTMATGVNIVGQVGFCPGQTVTLNAYPINANGAQTHTWQPGNMNTGSVSFVPSNTTTPTTYTLTYHDNGGTLTTTVNIFPLSANDCKNCEHVTNGHFEWYNTNPIAPFTTNSAWFYLNPNIHATPDYYNGLGTPLTPSPVSGYAYAGIFIYNVNGPYSWREYLQSQLTCSLVTGQKYDVSFYALLSAFSDKASNHLGAYLSQNLIVSNISPVNNLTYTPQVDRTTILNYSPTSTWTQIAGTVTGNNEKYITIGNFYNNANTMVTNSTSTLSTTSDKSYYYIDNISVTPSTPTLTASSLTVNCNSASTITLTAVGSASVYTSWTNGINTYTGSTVVVPTPSTTTTYTCNVNLPCASCLPITQTITVTFNNILNVTATANTSVICIGQASTLTATGATSYSWSTGQTGSSIVVTPTVATIYTVTGTGSMGCTNTKTVSVGIKGQYCCQSATFAVGSASANTNFSNNSNGGGTVIDILGSITFTANSTLTNYNIRMAPTASIHINVGVTVTFSYCTIFSCTELWGGIFINDGAGVPGTINVINSRIEDMYMGISHSGQNGSATGSANFINVSNSVLNNNYISVQLTNYPRANGSAMRQGLSFVGSTISSYYSATSPQNTLKSSSTYTYAYNNINNSSTPYVNFPRGIAGIYLNNLEEIPVIIGDSTGANGTNRFDNLDFGVYAENASVKAFNNHFINITGSTKQTGIQTFPPPPPPAGPDEIGVGIYAITTTTANPYWVRIGKVAGSTTPTGGNPYPGGNKFEDCGKGIVISNYKEPFIKGNVFTTTNTSVPPTVQPSELYSYYRAQNGMYIKEILANATITNNYILNHNSGIYTSHNIATGLWLPTYVKIENNAIEAPGTNGYCRQAIQTEQPLSTTNLGTGLLTVKNNTIQNVYNGIRAYNVKGGLQINDNPVIKIDVDKMTGVPGLTSSQKNGYARTGILAVGCVDAVIANNPNITGNGTVNSTYYTAVKGIWMNGSGGTNGQVNCNVISNMGRCMQFTQTSLNKVVKNVMNGTYQGLVLSNNGQIGPQGANTNTTHDNEWNGFTGGAAQYAETYTESSGTNANTNSQFFVKSGSPFQPTQNYSNVAGNQYQTGLNLGIDVKTGLSGENCLALRIMDGGNSNANSNSNAMRMASDADTTNIAIFEALASDTTFYEVYQTETQYRNKQLVYELLNSKSIDTTQTLNNFYEANQTSNYQTFTSINDAFVNADYQTAQTINRSLTTKNNIEEYQKRINELLIKYINNQSQPVDSNAIPFTHKAPVFDGTELAELSTIANSCFDKYGHVITQARVLMNNISNRIIEYEDNCKPEYNQRKGNSQTTKSPSVVKAKVYPNPNNGSMTLEYDLGTSSNGKIYISDIAGKLVSTYSLQNSTGKLEINADYFENGIYFYSIYVNEKNIKTDKIVVIK